MAAAAAMAAAVAAPFPVERGIVALEGAKTQTEPTAVPVTKKMRFRAALDKFPDAGTADAVIMELLWMSYMSVQVMMPMAVMEETAALTVAVVGLTVGRRVAPQLWTAHPRRPSQNIPIRASKRMICPDLGEIGFGRGRGFSQWFSQPPTTCLNFSLWRDLSVWRIWGGYFGHRRSGWGGVY